MIRTRGGSLEVVVYAGRNPITGREHRLTKTVRGTNRAAKTRAKQIEGDLLREVAQGRTSSERATFNELADQWLAVARHEASTRYQTERYLERHLRPALGPIQIANIRTAQLDQLYLALEEGTPERAGLAPSTVVRIHGIIRACLEQAVTWGWIATNPARRARLPELDRADPQAPDPTDVATVLALARCDDPELFVFLRLGAAGGLRRGSVCGIRWPDVDLVAQGLRHHRAIGQGKGAPYEKTTKSGGRHTIALDRRTIAILRWHRLRMIARAHGLDQELASDGYLFSGEPDATKPWRPDHATKRYRRVADAAGITDQLRNLRHFHATYLLAAGIDVEVVAGRLTHARTSTTLDIYGDRVPARDREAARVIAQVLDVK